LLRKAATTIASRGASGGEHDTPIVVEADDVRTYLGRPRFFFEVAERTAVPGVATGLAVTGTGGDVLFIEATREEGEATDGFTLTGQLGDVMKESAQIALSYVRSHADELGVADADTRKPLHVHVPAGAIPKDGPSAGVTMATAIVSALSGRRVRREVAMTGEITLRGRVLPIGGVKEKLLAAHRAGIKVFILPEKNKRDLIDIPKEVLDTIEIKTVDNVDQVLKIALQPGGPTVTPAQIEAATHTTVVPPPAH